MKSYFNCAGITSTAQHPLIYTQLSLSVERCVTPIEIVLFPYKKGVGYVNIKDLTHTGAVTNMAISIKPPPKKPHLLNIWS